MEKLLLHHCCAPCSPKVVETLSKDYDLKSFWYNPNIQPSEESAKRKEALKSYLRSLSMELVSRAEDIPDNWIWQNSREGAERCRLCYFLRLSETAREARRQNAAKFSTTLLSSPHQKHDEIRFIGEQIATAERVEFVYRDFRPWYYEGRNKVKDMKLHVQNYCGCIPSLNERKTRKPGSRDATRYAARLKKT